MAMRIREIDSKLVALCAAKTNPRLDDLYLDDAVDHAIRVKIFDDFILEGLIREEVVTFFREQRENYARENYK